MSIGAGYKLSTGTHVPASCIDWPITFTDKPWTAISAANPLNLDNREWPQASNPVSFFRMIKSSQDLTDLTNVDASASFHGWGASVNASASMAKELKVSQENTVVVLGWHYTTDMVWRALGSDNIRLSNGASQLLATKGPAEFAAVYGDYYVAGVKLGGNLYASYTMQFESASDKLNVKAAVEGAYQDWLSGSANFEKQLSQSNVKTTTSTSIRAQGFSGEIPPLNQSLEDLKALRDGFNLHRGVPLAAGLRSYEEVPGYLEALQAWEEGPGKDAKGQDRLLLPSPSEGIIKRANNNYFSLVYLYNTLKDLVLDKTDADDLELYQIRRNLKLLTGEGTGGAFAMLDEPNALHNLMTYDRYFAMGEDVVPDEEKASYEEGRRLYTKLFVARDLEPKVRDLLRRRTYPVEEWETTAFGGVEFASPYTVVEGSCAKFGNKPITKIVTYHGNEPGRSYLSQIELHFGSGATKQVFKAGRDSNRFGVTAHELDLSAGVKGSVAAEYVSKVEVRWGHVVDSLAFTTSTGRTWKSGGNGGGYQAIDGSKGVKGARAMLVGIKVAESPNELTGGTYIGGIKFIWRWSHPPLTAAA